MEEPSAKLEFEITAKESFLRAVESLQSLGTNAYKEHEELREKYGGAVAEDVRVVPEANSTAEALVDLLGTIPGVEITPKNRETIVKPGALIGSYRSVKAWMLKEGNHYIGATVDFPYQDWRKITVQLERVERVAAKNKIEISLIFTDRGEFRGGEILAGIQDGRIFSRSDGLQFNTNGEVSAVSSEWKQVLGENKKLNIPRILHSITTSENLAQPLDVKSILRGASL